MAHDVFISYSHQDKAAADAVCAKLEQHQIRCWIAPRDVVPGQEWGSSIIQAINGSRVMVLVFSASANASPQIRREIERAVNKGVIIVPLRIEDVVPTESLEYFMSSVHWLDALTPPLERHLDHLAHVVNTLLGKMEPREAPHSIARAVPSYAIEDKPASIAEPIAETVAPSPSHSPTEPPLELSHTSSPAANSPASRSISSRVILIGAVGLIALLAAIYFLAPIFGPKGGERWTSRTSGTTELLHSIFGTNDGKRVWAVGNGGTILASNDGGATWNRQSIGLMSTLHSRLGTSDGKQLRAVRFPLMNLDSNGGGESRVLSLNSRSLGTKIEALQSASIPERSLLSILGTSDGRRLIAVGEGGIIVVSYDSAHWNPLNWGATDSLFSIFGTSDGKLLWAVGENGAIQKSVDAGDRWNPLNTSRTQSLYSIFGTSDGKRLWAVGDNGVITQSDDGGEHWVQRKSPSIPFLYSVFGTSDGKRVWTVGAAGMILESDDGGANWIERTSGTSNDLTAIFGTSDGKRLWAVGFGGTILESGDGEHWIARTSGTTEDLHGIFGTRDGSHLWAVGDKGVILESHAGRQ